MNKLASYLIYVVNQNYKANLLAHVSIKRHITNQYIYSCTTGELSFTCGEQTLR